MGKKVDLKPQSASKPTAAPKATKLTKPEDSSESEAEEVQPAPRKLSAEKPKKDKKLKAKKEPKKPVKTAESDSEEEKAAEQLPIPTKKQVQKAAKKPVAKEESDSSEEPVPAPVKKDKKKKEKKQGKAEQEEEVKVPAKRAAGAGEEPKKKHKKEPKEKKEEVKKEPVDPADQTEIYVGGLSYTATEEDVKQLFSACGEIEAIKFLRKHDGAFRGAGFVKFATHEQALKALEFNETEHMTRTLKVNFAANKPNGGRPEGGINTVCVRNMSYESTDDAVASFFGQCGTVVSVRVARAQDGRGKGFAHVEFESVESADKAVGLSGQKLDERPLRVDYAHPKRNPDEPAAVAVKKEEKPKEKAKKAEGPVIRHRFRNRVCVRLFENRPN